MMRIPDSLREALRQLTDWLLLGAGLLILGVLRWETTLGKAFCLLFGAILILCIYQVIRALIRHHRHR